MSGSNSNWKDLPVVENDTAKKFKDSCLVSPGLAGVPTGYNDLGNTRVPRKKNWPGMKDNPFFPKEG